MLTQFDPYGPAIFDFYKELKNDPSKFRKYIVRLDERETIPAGGFETYTSSLRSRELVRTHFYVVNSVLNQIEGSYPLGNFPETRVIDQEEILPPIRASWDSSDELKEAVHQLRRTLRSTISCFDILLAGIIYESVRGFRSLDPFFEEKVSEVNFYLHALAGLKLDRDIRRRQQELLEAESSDPHLQTLFLWGKDKLELIMEKWVSVESARRSQDQKPILLASTNQVSGGVLLRKTE